MEIGYVFNVVKNIIMSLTKMKMKKSGKWIKGLKTLLKLSFQTEGLTTVESNKPGCRDHNGVLAT